MKSPTQKMLTDRATPLTVSRGATGKQMDGGSLVANGRKAPALSPQARRDVAEGRHLGRDLQPRAKK